MQSRTSYTHDEIWKWTLTADAIASCFAEDVFKLEENNKQNGDFYWLGSVPCRTVKLVGMLVGVQAYEKRIVYSVDDGTAVIDCVDRHPTMQPPKSTAFFGSLPLPIADVGASVAVIGNVIPRQERQIAISSIERCKHANDEPWHWLAARRLHRTAYSSLEPFSLPQQTDNAPLEIPPRPHTPVSAATSSAAPSPTKSIASSAAASPTKLKTLMKLRHPSRLHTRDLTDNTFRVYLKHYMDNAPPPSSHAESSRRDDFPISTPSKRLRQADPDLTPRATHIAPTEGTPRGYGLTTTHSEETQAIGFTLSFLRRVPELRDLARRVVKTEAKRRGRAAREKVQTHTQNEDATAKSGAAVRSRKSVAEESIPRRMKRLYQWALTALLNDGYIVLWDGSPRPCCFAGACSDTSDLWKTSASANITARTVDSTTSLASTSALHESDEEELSDPDECEESYVPLEPKVLARAVEGVVSSLIARKRRAGVELKALSTSKESVCALLQRDDRWRYLHGWQVEQALTYLVDEDILDERAEGRYTLRKRYK
ncbi:hypothetical protein HDZ31DRAFT_44858 [Schizophyllum fasciatum]